MKSEDEEIDSMLKIIIDYHFYFDYEMIRRIDLGAMMIATSDIEDICKISSIEPLLKIVTKCYKLFTNNMLLGTFNKDGLGDIQAI